MTYPYSQKISKDVYKSTKYFNPKFTSDSDKVSVEICFSTNLLKSHVLRKSTMYDLKQQSPNFLTLGTGTPMRI